MVLELANQDDLEVFVFVCCRRKRHASQQNRAVA